MLLKQSELTESGVVAHSNGTVGSVSYTEMVGSDVGIDRRSNDSGTNSDSCSVKRLTTSSRIVSNDEIADRSKVLDGVVRRIERNIVQESVTSSGINRVLPISIGGNTNLTVVNILRIIVIIGVIAIRVSSDSRGNLRSRSSIFKNECGIIRTMCGELDGMDEVTTHRKVIIRSSSADEFAKGNIIETIEFIRVTILSIDVQNTIVIGTNGNIISSELRIDRSIAVVENLNLISTLTIVNGVNREGVHTGSQRIERNRVPLRGLMVRIIGNLEEVEEIEIVMLQVVSITRRSMINNQSTIEALAQSVGPLLKLRISTLEIDRQVSGSGSGATEGILDIHLVSVNTRLHSTLDMIVGTIIVQEVIIAANEHPLVFDIANGVRNNAGEVNTNSFDFALAVSSSSRINSDSQNLSGFQDIHREGAGLAARILDGDGHNTSSSGQLSAGSRALGVPIVALDRSESVRVFNLIEFIAIVGNKLAGNEILEIRNNEDTTFLFHQRGVRNSVDELRTLGLSLDGVGDSTHTTAVVNNRHSGIVQRVAPLRNDRHPSRVDMRNVVDTLAAPSVSVFSNSLAFHRIDDNSLDREVTIGRAVRLNLAVLHDVVDLHLRQSADVDRDRLSLSSTTVTVGDNHLEDVVANARERDVSRRVGSGGEVDSSAVHFNPLVGIRNERSEDGVVLNVSNVEMQSGGVAKAVVTGAGDRTGFDRDLLRTIEEDNILSIDITASVGDLSHHREVILRSEDIGTADRGFVRVLPEELHRAHQVSAVGAVVCHMRGNSIDERHAVGRVEGAVAALNREETHIRELALFETEERLRSVAGHINVSERDGIAAMILNRVGSGHGLHTSGVRNAVHSSSDIGDVKEILSAVVAELDISSILKSGDGRVNRSVNAVEMTSENFRRHRIVINRRSDRIIGDVVEGHRSGLTAVAIDDIHRSGVSGVASIRGIGLVVSNLILSCGGVTLAADQETDVRTIAVHLFAAGSRDKRISTVVSHHSIGRARIVEVRGRTSDTGLVVNRDNNVLGAIVNETVLEFNLFPAGRAVEAEVTAVNKGTGLKPLLVGIVKGNRIRSADVNLHVLSRDKVCAGILESDLGDLTSGKAGGGINLLRVVVLGLVAERISSRRGSTGTNNDGLSFDETNFGAVKHHGGHIAVPLVGVLRVSIVGDDIDTHLDFGAGAEHAVHSHRLENRRLVQVHGEIGEQRRRAFVILVRHREEEEDGVLVGGRHIVGQVDGQVVAANVGSGIQTI